MGVLSLIAVHPGVQVVSILKQTNLLFWVTGGQRDVFDRPMHI